MMWLFFFFKQKTAYEIMPSLVGSEMCIRDRRADAQAVVVAGDVGAHPAALDQGAQERVRARARRPERDGDLSKPGGVGGVRGQELQDIYGPRGRLHLPHAALVGPIDLVRLGNQFSHGLSSCGGGRHARPSNLRAVSYTHLTLPTIY